jgi:hypothetical protein
MTGVLAMTDSDADSARGRGDLSGYPGIMTLDDYCAYYGISKATARRWLEEGRAARVPGHRHIKILRESVRLYEERLLEGFSN